MVRRSVSLSVTVVSPSKMVEPVEMLFGMWTWVGPARHVLDGGAYWCHLARGLVSG